MISARGFLEELGQTSMARGDLKEAESLFRRGQGVVEKRLGTQHPDLGFSLDLMAQVLSKHGDYAKAEPLAEQALALREKTLDADHPDLAQSLDTLAQVEQGLGRLDRAEELAQRALKMRETSLGPEHPDLAESLDHLASLYRKLGRDALAESYSKRALADFEREVWRQKNPRQLRSWKAFSNHPASRGDRSRRMSQGCRRSRSRCIETDEFPIKVARRRQRVGRKGRA